MQRCLQSCDGALLLLPFAAPWQQQQQQQRMLSLTLPLLLLPLLLLLLRDLVQSGLSHTSRLLQLLKQLGFLAVS